MARKPQSPESQPPGAGFRLTGLDPETEVVYVPLTGRSYVLSDLTADEAQQLIALKWPHIEVVESVA
ncbi:hypothetical protein [Larkinella soli]|uniref:hypothetical protein n=1 Tax=Larkinella soli TaxID=1770527 RepID=UPI000FFBC7CD|nr:hypothetical protein [Larkinella soli]